MGGNKINSCGNKNLPLHRFPPIGIVQKLPSTINKTHQQRSPWLHGLAEGGYTPRRDTTTTTMATDVDDDDDEGDDASSMGCNEGDNRNRNNGKDACASATATTQPVVRRQRVERRRRCEEMRRDNQLARTKRRGRGWMCAAAARRKVMQGGQT